MELELIIGWSLTIAGFLGVILKLLIMQGEERRALYNRIQAPEVEIVRDPKDPGGSVDYMDEEEEAAEDERGG